MSWYHRRTYLVTVGGATAPLPLFLASRSLVLSPKMTAKKMRKKKVGFVRLRRHHNPFGSLACIFKKLLLTILLFTLSVAISGHKGRDGIITYDSLRTLWLLALIVRPWPEYGWEHYIRDYNNCDSHLMTAGSHRWQPESNGILSSG